MSGPLYNQGLVYHKISTDFEWGLTTVSPKRFEAQVLDFQSLGFQFSTLRELSSTNRKTNLAITFDDGYASVYEQAWPVLEKYDIPATVFVITDYIGKHNTWDVQIGGRLFRHLDWEEIIALHHTGWEIGSHSVSHAILTNCSTADIRHELKTSKAILESRLGTEITSFCPPFNQVDDRVLEIGLEVGYSRCAVSFPLIPSPARYKALIVPRLGVYRHEWSSLVRSKIVLNYWTPFVVLQQQIINLAARGTGISKRLSGDKR